MIAKHGPEIFDLANRHNVTIFFEAAVGGGIPLISTLQRGLQANRISRVAGIVNGTTNYILTKMERERKPFAEALAEAQAAGFAEADPTDDVEGRDVAYKIAILYRSRSRSRSRSKRSTARASPPSATWTSVSRRNSDTASR